MYPERPLPDADLVPLPQCDGPKLKAFDFQGPQQIEFLDYLGSGTHAIVFKVKIRGMIYALKLFRFTSDESWISPADEASQDNLEALSAFYPYSEHFSCECRAFGRLQEAGHEELAVKCFGYVLLDGVHENALMNNFAHLPTYKLNFNYDGIVKEFGQNEEDLDNKGAKSLLRDIKHIQQLGITALDLSYRQIISGKLSDFSTAVTIPHFVSNPEWNPHLTPGWKSDLEFELFTLCYKDYRDFDIIVHDWNEEHKDEKKKQVKVRALPEGFPPERRHLRNTPARERLYTYVDPRNCKKYLPVTGRRGRIVKRKGALRKKPYLWYIECEAAAARRLKEPEEIDGGINWQYQNGHIAPLERE